jgi:hypothetical protein
MSPDWKGMPMSDTIRLQDLSAEEIAALLAKKGPTLTAQQACTLQEFVGGAGGIDNAIAVVEMLSELRDAA